MTTKTIKTIVFAALIATMILPFSGMQSAEATTHGEELTIEELQVMIETSESRIDHYETLLISAEGIRDHRIDSIITHQAILDKLDAIVDSDGVLTNDQIALYNDNVDDIIYLESENVRTESKISNYYAGIDRHQSSIDWAQAEIDIRDA